MKKTLDHSIQVSLKEFLQYRAQTDLEAFHTVSHELYRYEDQRFDYIAYGAPEAGWVYNTNIPGTVTPSISGQSGIVDYTNGRFLFPPSFPNINLTGTYTVNEINWYISNRPEAKIIFETKFQQSPVLTPDISYIEPYNYILPCAFVKTFQTKNEPYALGSEEWTTWNYRIIAMMPDESYLAGFGRVIRDCRQAFFPLLQNFPLNQLGALKEISWNYEDYMRDNEFKAFISDSTFQIEEPDVFISDNPKMYLGIGNIEVRIVRTPRIAGSDPNLNFVIATSDADDDLQTDIEDDFILT